MQRATIKNNIRMFTEADNQFHRTIVAYCNNETMLSIWESLKMQLQVIATLVETSTPLDKIFELHSPIVEAFKKNGPDSAAHLLKGHYKAVSGYWENTK
jgi:DNA-binding GntR family transcriptional regulator